MKELVRTVNAFLNTATRTELDSVMNEVILSDRQKLVFDLVCIKKKGIYFAACFTSGIISPMAARTAGYSTSGKFLTASRFFLSETTAYCIVVAIRVCPRSRMTV